jgi:biopolymer transport protein TolR
VASSVKRLVGDDTNTAVVISADRTVKYEKVVQVMDSLQRAGIARVGLSVQLAP